MHCTYQILLRGLVSPTWTRATTLPPSFLAPAFAAAQTSAAPFSASASANARKDGNPMRGISALRRTGMRKHRLSLEPHDLPQPVLSRTKRSEVEVPADHGLWAFFPSHERSMATPEEMSEHGRAWEIGELRRKDWNDLLRLWWTCVKEQNRLLTYTLERERVGNMYGRYESEEREAEVKRTMKRIKFVLTERWYTWEDARQAAMEDKEINMYADIDAGEAAFVPKDDLEELTFPDFDEGQTGKPQTYLIPGGKPPSGV